MTWKSEGLLCQRTIDIISSSTSRLFCRFLVYAALLFHHEVLIFYHLSYGSLTCYCPLNVHLAHMTLSDILISWYSGNGFPLYFLLFFLSYLNAWSGFWSIHKSAMIIWQVMFWPGWCLTYLGIKIKVAETVVVSMYCPPARGCVTSTAWNHAGCFVQVLLPSRKWCDCSLLIVTIA